MAIILGLRSNQWGVSLYYSDFQALRNKNLQGLIIEKLTTQPSFKNLLICLCSPQHGCCTPFISDKPTLNHAQTLGESPEFPASYLHISFVIHPQNSVKPCSKPVVAKLLSGILFLGGQSEQDPPEMMSWAEGPL